MDLLTLLGVIGASNIVTALTTWFLGGKRVSKNTAALAEIDILNKMKDYYRDEITRLIDTNRDLNENVKELTEAARESNFYKEWACDKRDCPNRSKMD